MKSLKMAAMAVVAGAGLAFVCAPAFAQSPNTSETAAEITAGSNEGFSASSTSLVDTSTTGSATAGSSTNDGDTISLGDLSSTGDGSGASAFGLNHEHFAVWHKVTSDTQSLTGGSGESLAAVFVFGQNIVVNHDGQLRNDSGTNDTATISGGFNSVSGSVALNQTAGVGNQQGNLFATVLELSGAQGGDNNSGSNSINVTDAQNLIVSDGEVENEEYVHPQTCIDHDTSGPCLSFSQVQPVGDSATISGGFGTVVGSVALNQSVGVANQQINSMTLAH